MRAKLGIAIAVGALAMVGASTASAQQFEEGVPYARQPVRAPRNAFEIGVGTGYTQGFGDIEEGVNVGDVANAGFDVGLALGYRATPGFGIGWSGRYTEFDADADLPGTTNSVRGAVTSLDASFHFMPYQRIDPWLLAGVGYRMLWQVPNGEDNNTLRHGFQLAKLQAGLDLRVSPDIAIGPMIGADLNLFVWENPEGSIGNREIDDKRVSTFIYAGVQGRFDVGGYRESSPALVSRR